MSAPAMTPEAADPPARHLPLDGYREAIADRFAALVLQAEVGARCADLRDDAGVRNATQRSLAYIRNIVALVADLEEAKDSRRGA